MTIEFVQDALPVERIVELFCVALQRILTVRGVLVVHEG
jgi:hypothetical protein